MTEDLEFVTESGVPAFKNMLQPSSLMYCHGTYLSIILSRVCVREKVWAFHVCSRNMCASTYTHTHTHTHTHRSHKKESHDCFPENVLLETKHALTQSLSKTACSTGRRRLIGSLIFIGHFPQKWPVALLWKIICNSGDPMSLRHPVHIIVKTYLLALHSRRHPTYSPTQAPTPMHTRALTHIDVFPSSHTHAHTHVQTYTATSAEGHTSGRLDLLVAQHMHTQTHTHTPTLSLSLSLLHTRTHTQRLTHLSTKIG